MIERMNELRKFIDKIYVPVGLRTDYLLLLKLLNENDYKAVDESDEGKMYPNALIIKTKGRGLYETFQGYKICRIDVGHVSKTMTDIAVYESDDTPVIPMRISKGNIKINLPE